MKYIFHTIWLILFSVIQPTLLEYTEIWGIKPNLFLIYVILISFYSSRKECMTVGFIFGCIIDLLVGRIIGLSAVLMMLLAYFIAVFCEKIIIKNTLLISLTTVAVSVFVYELMYYIVAFLGALDFSTLFINVLLPECLCSIIASIPFYFIIKKASKAFWTDKGEGIG